MVEQQPSKLMTRVRFPSPAFGGFRVASREAERIRVTRYGSWLSALDFAAAVAQLVEHVLGKDEVMSSSLISSSRALHGEIINNT